MTVLLRCRAQWLRGRASDSRLRGPGFESCAAVLKHRAIVFILHCSSSLSCINEYLAIDTGGYLCTNSLRALIAACWRRPREVEMMSDGIGQPGK